MMLSGLPLPKLLPRWGTYAGGYTTTSVILVVAVCPLPSRDCSQMTAASFLQVCMTLNVGFTVGLSLHCIQVAAWSWPTCAGR